MRPQSVCWKRHNLKNKKILRVKSETLDMFEDFVFLSFFHFPFVFLIFSFFLHSFHFSFFSFFTFLNFVFSLCFLLETTVEKILLSKNDDFPF